MPRFFRRFAFGCLLAGGSATALCVPSKEQLPSSLLYPRVVCEGFGRLFRCSGVGLTILWDYKYNLSWEDSQDAWDEVHQRSADKLVELAMSNGGLYVKSGQGFSQMNHLLPKQYCRTMRRLQDANLTRPFSEVKAVVETDLGGPIDEFFSFFDEEPIGAASLAQVHRAKLKDSPTTEVAVKVQYIDIADRFKGDLGTIVTLLSVCGYLFPGYDFGTLITKTVDILEAELRFKEEAQNCDACRTQLQPFFGSKVVTPKVVWSHTTNRILTAEYIDGVKITDKKRLGEMGFSIAKIAELYCAAFATQLFLIGVVHCDPHPGNVLVRPNPENPKESQLCILDHGLYTTMPKELRKTMSEIWTAMTRHDDQDLKAACAKLGISDYKLFASMLLQHPYELFSPFKQKASASDVELMRHMADKAMPAINEILCALPSELSLALRNINIVRSVNKELGNPVSRSTIMLKHSILTSHDGDWWKRWKCLLRLNYDETISSLLLRYARWKNPEMMKEMDEIFGMG